jgi:hypothetical protein
VPPCVCLEGDQGVPPPHYGPPEGEQLMPNTLQKFLADATQQAATDLETALLRLPEDKRNWSPMGFAHTALDMVAECAILNDISGLVQSRAFPSAFDFAAFESAKAKLAEDWEGLRYQLHQNTSRAVAAIRTVPDDDLHIEIQMPWGPMLLVQILAYPYWSMSYHIGQMNYLASMLGYLG